jgi:1-phosphatidylinositol-4-phosphate 5-kinase
MSTELGRNSIKSISGDVSSKYEENVAHRMFENQNKLYNDCKLDPNNVGSMNLLIKSYLLQQKMDEKDDLEYLRKQNQKLQNQIKSLEKQSRSQKRSIRQKQEKNKDMKEDINILRELHTHAFKKQRQKHSDDSDCDEANAHEIGTFDADVSEEIETTPSGMSHSHDKNSRKVSKISIRIRSSDTEGTHMGRDSNRTGNSPRATSPKRDRDHSRQKSKSNAPPRNPPLAPTMAHREMPKKRTTDSEKPSKEEEGSPKSIRRTEVANQGAWKTASTEKRKDEFAKFAKAESSQSLMKKKTPTNSATMSPTNTPNLSNSSSTPHSPSVHQHVTTTRSTSATTTSQASSSPLSTANSTNSTGSLNQKGNVNNITVKKVSSPTTSGMHFSPSKENLLFPTNYPYVEKEKEKERENANENNNKQTSLSTDSGVFERLFSFASGENNNNNKEEKDMLSVADGDKEPRPIFDDETVLDIITGLEVTINQKNWDVSSSDLFPKDYTYWFQFKVRRENHPLLKFKDFAPKVFSKIRAHFGISDKQYLNSFQYDNIKAIKGEGKSGAFFIFTKDKQFILKTATEEERNFLWQILPHYWRYISKNPDTLLPRFYGVYSMKHEGPGGVTRFIIMNNLFNTPYEPVEIYDLKGSTVGRFTTPKQRKEGVILKDVDIKNEERKLFLADDYCRKFVRILKRDTNFLAEHNVMDYSLLLGIHYETPDNIQKTKDNLNKLNNQKLILSAYKNCFQNDFGGTQVTRPTDNVKEIYYIGIIDILVQYENFKRAENILKKVVYYKEEASVIHPKHYANRFFSFICDQHTGILQPYNDKNLFEDSSSEEEYRVSGIAKKVTRL